MTDGSTPRSLQGFFTFEGRGFDAPLLLDPSLRYFPIAAKGSTHVSLRVVEDLLADTVLELFIAGTVVVDLGLIEIC
jgi:hypothetical protein